MTAMATRDNGANPLTSPYGTHTHTHTHTHIHTQVLTCYHLNEHACCERYMCALHRLIVGAVCVCVCVCVYMYVCLT